MGQLLMHLMHRDASSRASAAHTRRVAIVFRQSSDRALASRSYGHTRFRRELEHGCLLAFI